MCYIQLRLPGCTTFMGGGTSLIPRPHPAFHHLQYCTSSDEYLDGQGTRLCLLQICDSNHTHLLTIFQRSLLSVNEEMKETGYLLLISEAAMLFWPSAKLPTLPVTLFLLVQHLSPKDITGCKITSRNLYDACKRLLQLNSQYILYSGQFCGFI